MGKIRLTLACWDYDRTRALQDGREGHNADGREPHHPHATMLGMRLGRKGIKLGVTHMDQADEHEELQSHEAGGSGPAQP